MVAEEQVRQVPVQTVRKVVERVDNKVPVQVCRMVPEEQVRQVPVQVCRMVTEEKVEPVTTQVTRMVAEERTVQVARLVEKRTPVTETVRTPRTVVMKVPVDPCGNPLPAAAPVPAAAAKPAAVAPTPAVPSVESPAVPADAAQSAVPKTFGEKATPPARGLEGWTGSEQPHVDPSTKLSAPAAGSSPFRVERPAVESQAVPSQAVPSQAAAKTIDEVPLRSIETIPTPASTPPTSPSTGGPSVEVPTPANAPSPAVDQKAAAEKKVEESSTLKPIRLNADDRTT
jgi:hypothetical protein